MPRGRPAKSPIRERIVELLMEFGTLSGYELWKKYKVTYPSCSQRVIYYHLNYGVKTGRFVVKEVRSETGDYSWGTSSQKIYYSLSQNPQAR